MYPAWPGGEGAFRPPAGCAAMGAHCMLVAHRSGSGSTCDGAQPMTSRLSPTTLSARQAMTAAPGLSLAAAVAGSASLSAGNAWSGQRSATQQARRSEQYSLAKILGLWALACVPMGILGWVVFPLVAAGFEADPFGSGVARLLLSTLGLLWLFILSVIIVYREEGDLRWSTVKRRLRLTAPRTSATSARGAPGAPRARLWLWLVPLLVAVVAVQLLLAGPLESVWVSVFPFLDEPAGYSLGAIFKSREILARLVGAWWFLALIVVQSAFNTILGEEFLFRGVLLPKMNGAFGRWSWVVNGLLFGLYHVHQPWGMPQSALTGLLYAFSAYRFRSTWMSIILHSAQSVYFAFLVLGVVLGLGS
jgi:uncharacterized protein